MNSGKNRNEFTTKSEKASRDYRIFDDVIRFRLTTNEAIAKSHLAKAKSNATVKITRRLARNGWLQSYAFDGRRLYFVAGTRLIQQFGLPINRCQPLGPQSLATQLSLLEYCFSQRPSLQLLVEKEIDSILGKTSKEQRSLPLAIEPESKNTPLRLIRVDLGGTPAHVAKKLASDVRIRESHDVYAQLIAARNLIIVIITSTDAKKSFIEDAIRKRKWPAGLRFNVAIVRCLSNLLGVTK